MLFSYVPLSFLGVTSFVHASPLLDAKRSINVPGCLHRPNLTDIPPWSTMDDINHYLSIDAKTRVSYFWSGGVDGVPAKVIAEQCTGKAGPNYLTIGMAMCNIKKLTMPPDVGYDKYPEA